jgi:hypothetical protein
VPDRETFKVGFEALELTLMPPVALAADCGANSALKVTLAPGLRSSGKLSLVILKPVPVTVACEIVTLVPPVFVNESIRVSVPPTFTLPKARTAGLAVS